MSEIKISIAVCVWGTEALFKRSIETYAKQDMKPSEWQLIVVDDNALGDVESIIKPYKNDIQIEYIRFNHRRGMRGNTIGLNTAWMGAMSPIIAESTPETMWQPNLVRTLCETHDGYEKRFTAMKTWNFTNELQMKIDSVDWRSDVDNLQKIEGFRNDWTTQHEAKTNFRTHQTCSIRKKTMYEITKNFLLPTYSDYGSDDPKYSNFRETNGVTDHLIMDFMPYHQWHLPFNFFASIGHAPMLNKDNHTMKNVTHDCSGEIPNNGTSGIWDGGSDEKMSEEQKMDWRKWDKVFLETGGDERYLIDPKY